MISHFSLRLPEELVSRLGEMVTKEASMRGVRSVRGVPKGEDEEERGLGEEGTELI